MGKSSSQPPEPPAVDNSGMEQQLAMMQEAMGAMMEFSMSSMEQVTAMANQPPPMPEIPQIMREPIIDWAEKNAQLKAKSKADFGVDSARRKGRQDTIVTSPLLDDDETNVTPSLIA